MKVKVAFMAGVVEGPCRAKPAARVSADAPPEVCLASGGLVASNPRAFPVCTACTRFVRFESILDLLLLVSKRIISVNNCIKLIEQSVREQVPNRSI
jgi:hypothetical protein